MTPDTRNTGRILSELKKLYPGPHHYLEFDNPFQLLVATILSAQCTDERVSQVTKDLFIRFPGPRDFAKADIAVIEEAVRPTGFYRNKAKAIKAASIEIIERFDGEVPDTMEELASLPGLARKSANAVLQHGFSKVEGIVVDTHVIRLAGRLGWSESTKPAKIEKDLMELFDRGEWRWIPFYLKNHGRAVCRAQKPACGECALAALCPSAFITPPGGKAGKAKKKRA